jgi:O-antigen ligase
MNALIAAAACTLAVAYFFWRDRREQPETSAALWIPLIWVFLAGSRYVSYWIGQGGGGDYDDGNPLDAAVFGALIVAGLVVLSRRAEQLADLAWVNKLLLAYFAYSLVSAFWSDQPGLAGKRWIKDLGNPIMALVILSDRQPMQALGVVLLRFAYIALPVSVLFVRYYPEMGRQFHFGVPTYTGIGYQKNALGQICLVTGLYFAWQVLVDRANYLSWRALRKLRLWLLVGMLAYLVLLADSKTSLVCLLLALTVLVGWRMVGARPARLLVLIVVGSLTLGLLEVSFGLRDSVLVALGRDANLTNRTDLWAVLSNFDVDWLLGSGFMSFWSGDRLQQVWALVGATVIQAHNGYLEQYLNLGVLGVGFIVLLLGKGLIDAARASQSTTAGAAPLRMAIIVVAATYNVTESAFYGINNLWLLLLFALMNGAPASEAKPAAYPPEPAASGLDAIEPASAGTR